MPNFLACLLKEAAHDETWAHLRVIHHHFLDEDEKLWLQKASVIDLELVVVDHLEFIHALIETDLVIPLESNVDWAGTLARGPLSVVIEISITESGLVPQVAAQTEEDKFAVAVFFLVHREHGPIRVAKLTVSVNCVKHAGKGLGKMSKVESESTINRSFLLFGCQGGRV